MRRPATTEITLSFGYHADYPLHNGYHQGVDFSYVPDAQIYAPAAGTVIVRPLNGDDGNAIYMQIGDQFHGFCHMQSFAVSDGQRVTEGQVLGIMGDTGAAEGRHLHWAVKLGGSFVDPLTLVNEGVNNMSTITDVAEVNGLWQLNGLRAPDEREVKEAIGRDLKEYLTYLLNTEPVKHNVAKVQYYDQDVAAAAAKGVDRQAVVDYIGKNLK